MVSLKEAEKDGGTIGGVGSGEKLSTQRLDTSTEEVETLGHDLSTPKMSSKLSDFSTLLLPTIPESDKALGRAILSPVKTSQFAGDMGSDSFMPDKQPKQLKIFQRRESPSSKTTRSWVAERVS
jgi:hypothetical protein